MRARRLGPEARASRPQDAPLNLIHRNKSPNPVSTRVSGRFEFPGGLPLKTASEVANMPPAVAFLVLRRIAIEGGGYVVFPS